MELTICQFTGTIKIILMSRLVYFVPSDFDIQNLIEILPENYDIRTLSIFETTKEYFDTFDWRLFSGDKVLFKEKDNYTLRKLYSNEVLADYKSDNNIVFIEDVKNQELRNQISSIKMRALLPLVKVQIKNVQYNIIDKEGKTIARLRIESYKPIGDEVIKSISPMLVIESLRGYAKQFKSVISTFEKNNFEQNENFDLFVEAVKAVNKIPGDYSSKLNIQLSPNLRSDKATKIILSDLLDTLEINEPLILEDIDTEFLHDFRVSVRRSRSALSQIKEVFPPQLTNRFKRDLAYIGKLTNKLRDLDVYELKEEEYQNMIPADFKIGMDYIFELIHKKRKTAYLGIFRSFSSAKYKKIKSDWRAYLETEDSIDNDAPNANRPILDVAKERINKKYATFVKLGKKILKHNIEEDIHLLRIEGKKLRYLIEFFSSLFEKEKVDMLLKQMKTVQDNLGDFNDYCIQQEYLMNFASELDSKKTEFSNALLAIGALVGILTEKKEQEKAKFTKIYKKFSSPENQQLFNELFT